MQNNHDDSPVQVVRFSLQIDGVPLGEWTECSGIGLNINVEKHPEGGNSGFSHQLMGAIEYPNVTFKRNVNGDTALVKAWLATLPGGYRPGTGHVVALDEAGHDVVRFDLINVIPVRYTGPSQNVGSPGPATESIELAHHGWLP